MVYFKKPCANVRMCVVGGWRGEGVCMCAHASECECVCLYVCVPVSACVSMRLSVNFLFGASACALVYVCHVRIQNNLTKKLQCVPCFEYIFFIIPYKGFEDE